jgi:soluble lytic murein transglycosylase
MVFDQREVNGVLPVRAGATSRGAVTALFILLKSRTYREYMRSAIIILLLGGLMVYIASQPQVWGPFIYPLQFRPYIKTYAGQYGLDPNLVSAVIFVESRFFPGQVSRAGALGLMQVLPSTAKAIASNLGDKEYTENNLLDPERNIRYGTYYLKYLFDKYKSETDLVLAAYNAGETNVDRWQKDQQGIAFDETKEFVAKVKQAARMYDTIYGKWYLEEKPQ